MSTIEKSYWDENYMDRMLFWEDIIWMLKNNLEYKHIHLVYDSKKGWCYCSYKSKRIKITWDETFFEIKNKLLEL